MSKSLVGNEFFADSADPKYKFVRKTFVEVLCIKNHQHLVIGGDGGS